jgi:inner membrane protein
MNPVTHALISWGLANTCKLEKKDRILVTAAGIIPDIDGLGIIGDFFSRHPDQTFDLWSRYHHTLGHNLLFSLIVTFAAFGLSARKKASALLVFLAFQLHLFCDVVGARGPDGYQWPIPYLWPFSDRLQLTWSGQWALNAWPNIAITLVMIGFTLYLAWKKGFSIIGIFSEKADQALVFSLRNRFGQPSEAAGDQNKRDG